MFVMLADPPPGVPQTLDALKKAGVPVFAYGNFLTIVVNFVILAFIIFMMVRAFNKMREKEAEPRRPSRRKTSFCCAKSATA
jgi:large conductance mechanosensitive channel